MDEMDNRNRSLRRSRGTAISLARLFGKTAVNSLFLGLPVGDVLDVAIDHVRAFEQDRRKGNYEAWIRQILDNCSGLSPEELEEAEFDLDDFVALSEAVLREIESEKIKNYATLFHNLLQHSIDHETTFFLVVSCRELSSLEIELAKKLYVFSRDGFTDFHGNSPLTIVKESEGKSPLHVARLSKLKTYGLVDEKGAPTQLLGVFCTSTSPPDELEPEAFGYRSPCPAQSHYHVWIDDHLQGDRATYQHWVGQNITRVLDRHKIKY